MREKNDRYEALLKGALTRIEELEQEVARTRSGAAGREPVAIVGMGCRFPGAEGPEAYWRLLAEGRDAITEVPADRWDVDAYYDPDPDAPGRMSTRHGGFLDDLTGFDAALFGISAREAAGVDPQQRLLMEVSWEAFEDAGMPVKSLPARTGVFVGISNVDYREAMVARGADTLDGYFSSGSTTSTASGRLSYFLGLTGPSLSVDTACSSSLVSVHLAVMNLRDGACDLALAGGVNLIVTPHETISLSKARMMAPDGRCKPFDAAADGYVRAEGCGMIVLKRLTDARRDGDRVLAVIRGSATNQDGHRSGLTVPHGPSQQDVIRQALRDAGAEPHEIGYVEAHGTGTALGDPIEAAALGAVFAGRPRPLAVGSVKSNMGHLEAAAGIAGVIKAVLAMRAGVIPPTLHLHTPSPLIDWDELPLKVPTALEPWREDRRLAGVSSFGFSGTNCHLVLEGPAAAGATGTGPSEATPTAPPADGAVHVLTVSGATPAALDEAGARMAAFLADGAGGASLADVCLTAATGRSHLEHRRAVVAGSADELARGLTDGGPGTFEGQVRGARSVPEVAFLFTGQGSQYPDMGRELYERQPVFRRALDECADILDPILGRPLTTLLYPDPADAEAAAEELRKTRFTQPALFAVEYALARLWRSWGIEPVAVLGHSVGEYTAACVAGVFSLADGLRLVAERARLMQRLPAGGVMVALRARPEQVEDVVRRYPLVSVAAVNGPEDVVVSGDGGQVREAVAELAGHGESGRDLRVSHAFHSPLMEPVTAPLTEAARSVRFSAPRIPVISNVTGAPVGAEELCDPGYWARHTLAPVRFADGVRALYASGARAFVEIGPRPVLLGLGRGCVPEADALWLPSLRPGRDGTELLTSLAALHVRGVPVDWASFHRDRRPAGRRVALPTYPFQHERHWFTEEPPAAPARSTALTTAAEWAGWLVGVEWSEVAGEDVGPGLSGRWCVVGGSDASDGAYAFDGAYASGASAASAGSGASGASGASGGLGGSGGVDLGPGVTLVGEASGAEHVVFVASGVGDVSSVGGVGASDASRGLALSVGLLGLVQRLSACAVPPRLYVVTSLGQVVRGLERPDPAQGA
ncbi:type I polyketide synthase, partial [Streptomyces sp. NPDC003480]